MDQKIKLFLETDTFWFAMLHLQSYTFNICLHSLNSNILFHWGLELSFQALQLKFKFLTVLRSRRALTAAKDFAVVLLLAFGDSFDFLSCQPSEPLSHFDMYLSRARVTRQVVPLWIGFTRIKSNPP